MRYAKLVLLAWWFLLNTGYQYGAIVVGPFDSQESCEKIRSVFTGRGWCWWGRLNEQEYLKR